LNSYLTPGKENLGAGPKNGGNKYLLGKKTRGLTKANKNAAHAIDGEVQQKSTSTGPTNPSRSRGEMK